MTQLASLHRGLNSFFCKPSGRKPVQSWIVRIGSNGDTNIDAVTLGIFGSKAEAIKAMTDYNAEHPTSAAYAWFPERV